MKNLFDLPLIIAVAILCSCQKHPTDEELQARIEREVKRQLAAERELQEKELEQRRAELTARRNALLEGKGAATNTLVPGVPRVPNRPSIGDRSANPATALSPGAIRIPRLPPGASRAPISTKSFCHPNVGSVCASLFGNLSDSFGDTRRFGIASLFAVA